MTSSDIQSLFPAWVPVFFYDLTYACPTEDWLLNKFYPWFKKSRWDNDVSRWTRKNDCDNFARAFVVYAQDAHAVSDGSTAEGLAVGEFCYVTRRGESHAIVTVVIGGTDVIFVEPQTGEKLELNEQEKRSCFRVSF